MRALVFVKAFRARILAKDRPRPQLRTSALHTGFKDVTHLLREYSEASLVSSNISKSFT
jgi:hypothetical protein